MTIAEINAALQGQLPNIVLSPATFGQDAVLTPVLQINFPDTQGAVTITGVTAANYKFDSVNGVITFSGTGQGGPFDGMSINPVVIKMDGTTIQIAISATAKDGLSLHTLFPSLNAPIIQQLPLSQPQLYWANYESDTDETILWFYVDALLDIDAGPLSLVSALLPGLDAPELSGQFEMVGNNTGEVLQSVPSGSLDIIPSDSSAQLGPLTITAPVIEIFANANFNTNDKVWQTDNMVRLSNTLTFQDNLITFSADIRDLSSDIIFDAEMDLPIAASLVQLVSFMGVEALGVPGFDLKFPNDLNFKDLQVVFNPKSDPTVKLIALTIGTSASEKWPLWGDVSLNNIEIIFHILPGSKGEKTVIDGEFSGQVNSWLQLRAAFSTDGNYTLYGGLAQPVSIGELYTFFTGATNPDLPNLNVETFFFELDLSKQDQQTQVGYDGDLTMNGEWDIVDQPKFSLDGLLFKVSKDPGGSTSIEAGGIMTISDYSLAVDGKYATGDGWTLSGDLDLKEEKKSLTEIGAKIDDTFGTDQPNAKSIPDFLTAWQVQSLHTDFNTKSKNFNFGIDIKNADAPGLDLNFGIHLTHSGTEFTKEFDATATYISQEPTPKINVEFDIIIKEEDNSGPPATKKFTLTGTYKAVTPPTLADLLEAISKQFNIDAALPAELNLNAEADGFALEIEQTDKNPVILELAGEFSIQFEGSDLNLYFAYTNEVTSDAAFQKPILVDGKPAYVFGASLGGVINLSKLPVVGKIPGIDHLAIDKLGFFYTNAALTQGQQAYFQVPQVSGPGQLAPNPSQAVLSKQGFNLLAVFGRQGQNNASPISPMGTMNIPVATGPAQNPPVFAQKAAQPDSPVHWIDIDKTFGPVSLHKIGLNYSDGEATFGISAGFAVTGFVLDLEGLTITFPMPLPKSKAGSTVSFDLQGLGFDIKKGDLEIGGGFLKSEDAVSKIINYYGEVIVKAGPFGLTAIGGYAPDTINQQTGVKTPASFFLFANINVPLGGPPFFFVTGFAGGFGINRNLRLPTIDQMPYYPLIPHNANANLPVGGTPKDALSTVLPALATIFEDKPGEYWVAAGIQFTSFEMIDAFALVTVLFGVDLQIALLGQCSMTFPKGDTEAPLAYIEIDILASVNPALGQFALDGRLTPASFVFANLCHISGGFAFYFWFGGEYKGDFVVSIGGYHPAFVKPDNYPTVPRLSMSYGMGPFHIGGEAYFSLTPRMMMAGMRVYATWDAGPLKAWFDAGFDFLLGWAPFHYEADAYVHIGISLNLGLFSITVHVGVDLTMWGPEFGGLAHIDLSIVTFTIHFGAGRSTPAPLDWSDFEKSFLPADAKPKQQPLAAGFAATADTTSKIGATVATGLLQQNAGGYAWILDPENFVIHLDSKIPSNVVQWNGDANVVPNDQTKYEADGASPYLQKPDKYFSKPDPTKPQDPGNQIWNPDLHIGPMDKGNITSYLTVTLNKLGENGGTKPLKDFTIEPVLGDVPQSLWGKAMDTSKGPATDLNKPQLLPFALTGLLISPIPRHPDQVSNIPLASLIFQQFNQTTFVHSAKAVDPGFTVAGTPSKDGQTLSITITANPPLNPAPNSPLTNTAYCLSALQDSWIQNRRSQLLDALDAPDSGFQTWSKNEVDLTSMAKKALTDWPVVELLGA